MGNLKEGDSRCRSNRFIWMNYFPFALRPEAAERRLQAGAVFPK